MGRVAEREGEAEADGGPVGTAVDAMSTSFDSESDPAASLRQALMAEQVDEGRGLGKNGGHSRHNRDRQQEPTVSGLRAAADGTMATVARVGMAVQCLIVRTYERVRVRERCV